MRSRLPITGFVVLQLLAGLAIQLSVIAILGAGRQSDMFVAAQAVPTMVFAVLSAPLQNLWQPTLATSAEGLREWTWNLRAALGQCGLLFGAVAIVCGASAHWWVPGIFSGFSAAEVEETVILTQLLLGAAVLNGLNAIYALGLRTRSRFVAPEAISALATLFAVAACILLVPRFGIAAAVHALLARSLLMSIALMHCCHWTLPAPQRGVRTDKSWRSVGFLVGTSSICEAIVLVDRHLSSLAPEGGMTAYSLAKLGMASAATILERSLSVPFAPGAARAIADKRIASVLVGYRQLVRRLTLLSLALGLLLILLQPAWTWALHALMDMEESLAEQMWWICLFLLGYAFVAPAASAHATMLFAMGDTRTVALINVLSFAVEAGLKFLLFEAWGLIGLAIGTSVSLSVNFFLCRYLALAKLRALGAIQHA